MCYPRKIKSLLLLLYCYHLQENFKEVISILTDVGEDCNTVPMNFSKFPSQTKLDSTSGHLEEWCTFILVKMA